VKLAAQQQPATHRPTKKCEMCVWCTWLGVSFLICHLCYQNVVPNGITSSPCEVRTPATVFSSIGPSLVFVVPSPPTKLASRLAHHVFEGIDGCYAPTVTLRRVSMHAGSCRLCAMWPSPSKRRLTGCCIQLQIDIASLLSTAVLQTPCHLAHAVEFKLPHPLLLQAAAIPWLTAPPS